MLFLYTGATVIASTGFVSTFMLQFEGLNPGHVYIISQYFSHIQNPDLICHLHNPKHHGMFRIQILIQLAKYPYPHLNLFFIGMSVVCFSPQAGY